LISLTKIYSRKFDSSLYGQSLYIHKNRTEALGAFSVAVYIGIGTGEQG
jgi:hypothetical protein